MLGEAIQLDGEQDVVTVLNATMRQATWRPFWAQPTIDKRADDEGPALLWRLAAIGQLQPSN